MILTLRLEFSATATKLEKRSAYEWNPFAQGNDKADYYSGNELSKNHLKITIKLFKLAL